MVKPSYLKGTENILFVLLFLMGGGTWVFNLVGFKHHVDICYIL